MGDFVRERAFEELDAVSPPVGRDIGIHQCCGIWGSSVHLRAGAVDEVAPIGCFGGVPARVLDMGVLDGVEGGEGC